jgi:ATP-binding cassette subfamily B protein
LGIVGETGAGKSTLLSLIGRLYDVTQGSIRVDGIDVRDLELNELRRAIGAVFQDSFLFSHTVAANISFGRPNASDDDIRSSAEIASAHGFISEMPDGYETLVGEHGSNLSGGQRQRLSLARALLVNPPILLLDDATAAVDPETEHEIQQAISHALEGRTTIMVSNRISALRRADRILILDQGRIAAIGTHEDLVQTNRFYRHLVELQCGLHSPVSSRQLQPAAPAA